MLWYGSRSVLTQTKMKGTDTHAYTDTGDEPMEYIDSNRNEGSSMSETNISSPKPGKSGGLLA